MIMTIPLLLAVASQFEGCLAVQAEKIYARDIVPALPAFGAIPGEVVIGYSPVPGVRRVLTPDTLVRIARTQGVTLEGAAEICIERQAVKLAADEIRAAMLASLDELAWKSAPVQIELKSWGPESAPPGKIVFPRSGLQLPPAHQPNADATWRGYIEHGNGQRVPVWARARVTITAARVVAVTDLRAGSTVNPDDVRLEISEAGALDDRVARTLDEVVGFVPRNFIRAGSAVVKSQLTRLPDVAKGDVVQVQVRAGAARLVLEGRAQSSGAAGATIWVKNLSSGKEFRATVSGKGKVTVQ
jgi:flagella basal body P-ring formation protein FlgA